MFKSLLHHHSTQPTDLLDSQLFNEETFYPSFLKDLENCLGEVIIESPFITNRRINLMLPVLEKLKSRKVRVVINTRDPKRHDNDYMCSEAYEALSDLQHLGVHVIYTDSHHRKLAIIDRSILYEGSLNILSQNNSREVMRRIQSAQLAWQMAAFVEIDKFLS